MPGFSYRSARWGYQANLSPSAPAKLLYFATPRRRYYHGRSGFLGLVKATQATPETEAFIPKYLTNLKSHFNDVHPLAPPELPYIRHLKYLKARTVYRSKIVRAYFFGGPQQDVAPITSPDKLRRFVVGNVPRTRRFGFGFFFGPQGGDAVGATPPVPKKRLTHFFTRSYARERGYTSRGRVLRSVIIPSTDKLYPRLVSKGTPRNPQRAFYFLKYRPRFIPTVSDWESLTEFFNLRIRLDVKKAVDSGEVVANSGDAGGTTVNFNRAFKDVESIVCTVQETADFSVVVDFVDIPNPTFFKVLVFNQAGTRVTKTVRWVARGII